MSAPDYRPYLREGDLRTPEEVAKWMRSLSFFSRERPWRQDLAGACDELDERLDRERRQACRRGARIAWRAAAKAVRASRECTTGDLWWATHAIISSNIYRALAFRAAARAK